MTRKEFLEALSRTPRDWYLDEDGGIRRKSTERFATECPISSLCNMSWGDYRKAGRKLGLSYYLISLISITADDFRTPMIGHLFRPALRKKMLKACGLEERRR